MEFGSLGVEYGGAFVEKAGCAEGAEVEIVRVKDDVWILALFALEALRIELCGLGGEWYFG